MIGVDTRISLQDVLSALLIYHAGVDCVKAMRRRWATLQQHIGQDMYLHVQDKLATQEKDAGVLA
ncbi:MAG: hypothetical protein JSU70_15335 [Phycisphaerales bacterium]|nr:MAG: hypothetical protein JSU70_15335 [Phycisphaerales bacterium]